MQYITNAFSSFKDHVNRTVSMDFPSLEEEFPSPPPTTLRDKGIELLNQKVMEGVVSTAIWAVSYQLLSVSENDDPTMQLMKSAVRMTFTAATLGAYKLARREHPAKPVSTERAVTTGIGSLLAAAAIDQVVPNFVATSAASAIGIYAVERAKHGSNAVLIDADNPMESSFMAGVASAGIVQVVSSLTPAPTLMQQYVGPAVQTAVLTPFVQGISHVMHRVSAEEIDQRLLQKKPLPEEVYSGAFLALLPKTKAGFTEVIIQLFKPYMEILPQGMQQYFVSHGVHITIKGLQKFMQHMASSEGVMTAYTAFEKEPNGRNLAILRSVMHEKLKEIEPGYELISAQLSGKISPLVDDSLDGMEKMIERYLGFPAATEGQKVYLKGMASTFFPLFIPFAVAHSHALMGSIQVGEAEEFLGQLAGFLKKGLQKSPLALPAAIAECAGKFALTQRPVRDKLRQGADLLERHQSKLGIAAPLAPVVAAGMNAVADARMPQAAVVGRRDPAKEALPSLSVRVIEATKRVLIRLLWILVGFFMSSKRQPQGGAGPGKMTEPSAPQVELRSVTHLQKLSLVSSSVIA